MSSRSDRPMANSRRLSPVASLRCSVKTLTPAVCPGKLASMPTVPTARTTQP